MSTAVARSSRPNISSSKATACFFICARAEPGVMPRVLELFAKRGLVPSRWNSATGGSDGYELTVDIQMREMDTALVDYLTACLRQIVGVETVLTSQLVRSGNLKRP